MECLTKYTDKDGIVKIIKKKQYLTLELAIAHCKVMNARDIRQYKIVSYKCKFCCKYHTGRNGKVISEKDKEKYKKEIDKPKQFKIIGKIDLTLIK